MNTATRVASFVTSIRRVLLKPALGLGLILGISIATVAGAGAQGNTGVGWHHGSDAMNGSADDVVAHVNGMLQYIYTEVGATEGQKTQLASISQEATGDLARLHDQLAQGHAQVFGILTQDSIDRAALETARAAHMAVAEQASRRATAFVADVAEVLTPVQRKALANHFAHQGK